MGVVGGHVWAGWLVAHGREGTCHGEPLLHQVQVGAYDVLQPLARVTQDDQQDQLQLLGLPTCVEVAGHHGRVQAG